MKCSASSIGLGVGPFDGCFHEPVIQADKHHMTGKPTKLMQRLVEIVPRGGTVLDAFQGSGSTGVACVKMGRNYIGIEREAAYDVIARRRIRAAA